VHNNTVHAKFIKFSKKCFGIEVIKEPKILKANILRQAKISRIFADATINRIALKFFAHSFGV
jgi:hypothetical protein